MLHAVEVASKLSHLPLHVRFEVREVWVAPQVHTNLSMADRFKPSLASDVVSFLHGHGGEIRRNGKASDLIQGKHCRARSLESIQAHHAMSHFQKVLVGEERVD